MKRRVINWIFLSLLFFTTPSFASKSETPLAVKYHPGHYVAVKTGQHLEKVKGLKTEPAIRGVLKRYYWAHLEPEKGRYDFSEIKRDLAVLRPLKKQLVVFICDKTFSPKDPNPLPPYMRSIGLPNLKKGVTAPKWIPKVIDREIALCKALSAQFDADPRFEGVACSESAPSLNKEELRRSGYTPEKLRDGLKRWLIESSKVLPHSQVFWFMNFIPQNDGSYLREIAEAAMPYRVVMGGPDILPYRIGLQRGLWLYEDFNGKLKLFGSMQNDSYRHHRADKNNSEKHLFQTGKKPIPPSGYIPLEEIFFYGRDQMHLNYIFWNYKTWRGKQYPGNPQEWIYDDALKVIRKYPTFNP